MKKTETDKQSLKKIKDLHVDIFKNNSSVQQEVFYANMLRLNYLALILIIIHTIMAIQIWFTEVDAVMLRWKNGVLINHYILIVYMVAIFILTFRNRHKKEGNKWLRLVPFVTGIVVMGAGVTITILDQLFTPSITPMMIACIVTGTILLLRPGHSLLIYGFFYMFYYNYLETTVTDEAILMSNRLNGFSIMAIGMLLSIIFWRYFYTTTTQERFIKKQQYQLEQMAYKDPLTGLPNRRHFDYVLKLELKKIQENNHSSTLILLDIDDFKRVNDTLGHPVGDEVLQDFSSLLHDNIRGDDIVARFGGEEFIILLPNINPSDGYEFAERIRKVIEEHMIEVKGKEIHITASFGLVGVEQGLLEFAKLYDKLDKALKKAKLSGKNKVILDSTSETMK